MSAPLLDEDKAFIRAILNDPAELTTWLVYADWLDEHDDPRAEFIRLEIRRLDPNITQTERYGVIGELEDVRARLDPYWVAIFERPRVENCDEMFAFKCPKQWEQLKGTDDPLVRDCDACQKKVYYCLTRQAARDHAQHGDCVAVQPGMSRYSNDLTSEYPADIFEDTRMVMGMLAGYDEPETPRRPWWKFW